MKIKILLIITFLLLIIGACITKFIPEIRDEQNLLVIDGMITDQAREYTIKLSLSMPIGKTSGAMPVDGASVNVTDDIGNVYTMFSKGDGLYSSNNLFRGVVGRKYALRIQASLDGVNYHSFESPPVELKAVPPIDTLYHEKVTIAVNHQFPNLSPEGCQIYLDTHDNGQDCKYYRWGYKETWEFHLPWTTPNNICWITQNSSAINIKNTSELTENRIIKYPLNFISNNSDRLAVKYSMLVSQYSISQDEYIYWEKLKHVSENVGGLYDMIPASIIGNVICTDDKSLSVLGYFSVSGETSKRVFVKEHFADLYNPYAQCVSDTALSYSADGLGIYFWILFENFAPRYYLITTNKGCYDCTMRGTNIKPDFWVEDKSAIK